MLGVDQYPEWPFSRKAKVGVSPLVKVPLEVETGCILLVLGIASRASHMLGKCASSSGPF